MTYSGQRPFPAARGHGWAKGRLPLMSSLAAAFFSSAATLALAGPTSVIAIPPPVTRVVNPISRAPVVIDGLFSGIAPSSTIAEWSDITPLAFIGGNPEPLIANRANPLADSFVYTGVAAGIAAGDGNALYLMYDYHARTNPFLPGDVIATVSFPITPRTLILGARAKSSSQAAVAATPQIDITVEVAQSAAPGAFACQTDAGISTTQTCTIIDAQGNRSSAAAQGILGAAGFGTSLERPNDPAHLLVELEVPVLVTTPTPAFPLTGHGVYSPDPQFWGASATDNAGDPPISSSIVSIDPLTGTTTITFAAPEPATLALFGMGVMGLAALRRQRR